VAIRLAGVSKTYGTVPAVSAVDLTVQSGEFFTLLGASGSGKTTLLRLIGGFERPNTGQIWLGNQDVTSLPPHQRQVHTVFQDYALFPHLSVFDNIGFSLNVQRLPKPEVLERVQEALKLVQLPHLAARFPAQLSGGQQQRVAIARAIVDRPKVLLLDEPLSALDAKIRVELREELKQLQRQTGISFIYITHDQEEALALSDRIAVMREGKILQVGTPLAIYEQPADLYVAEFIGRANFLAGTLVSVDAMCGQVQVGEQLVMGTLTTALEPGCQVRLVVRPENIHVSADHSALGLPATIRLSQYLGYATHYILHSSIENLQVLELRRRGTRLYHEGDNVYLSWDCSEALIFAADIESS
jgi:spermidine/putrescine transport system ATP-binding protein